MTDLHDKLAELRDDFRPDWDDEKTEQALAGVPSRRRSRRNRKIAVVAVAGLAAASGVFLTGALESGVSPPTDPSTTIVRAPETNPDVQLLADGSRVTKKSGQPVRVSENGGETRMEMGEGRSIFELAAVTGRTYYLAVGHVDIETAQATFDVESGQNTVSVFVHDGNVEVVEPNGSTREISKGGRDKFVESGQLAAVPIVFNPQVGSAEPHKPERVEKSASDPVGSDVQEAESWSEFAQRGEWKQANEHLASIRDIDGIEMLLLAADVKRYNSQPNEAIRLLERAAREFPEDERATMAQFQKGRIEMELGQHSKAARSWERVGEMSPSSSLAEDALSREVEAWFRAGDKAKAKVRAQTYLERFPNGYRAPMVRRYGGVTQP